jgi:hypothetical protein
MKRFFTLLLICQFSLLLSQNWEWAFNTTGITAKIHTRIAADNSVYMAAPFADTCRVKGMKITGTPGKANLILAKFAPNGNLIWTKIISASFIEPVNLVTRGGDVILGGNFSGKLTGLVPDSVQDMKYFFVSYNQNGLLTDYKRENGTGSCIMSTFDLSSGGEILVAGVYKGAVEFSGTAYNSGSKYFGFLLRYGPFWSIPVFKHFNQGVTHAGGWKVHSDPYDNIYLQADFSDTLNIADDSLVVFEPNVSYYGHFLLRFDASGKFRKHFITSYYYSYMTDFSAHGNAGYTLRFIPFSGCNHCTSGSGVRKVTDQDSLKWARSYGGAYSSGAPNQPPVPAMNYGAYVASQSQAIMSGHFQGPIKVGNDSVFGNGMIIINFDHQGEVLSKTIVNGQVAPHGFSNMNDNSLMVTGTYGNKVLLGPFVLDSIGQYKGFVAKLNSIPVGLKPSKNIDPDHLDVYPNPVHGTVTIRSPFNNSCEAKVFDVTGREIFSQMSTSSVLQLNFSDQSPGIYFLQLRDQQRIVTKKLLVY